MGALDVSRIRKLLMLFPEHCQNQALFPEFSNFSLFIALPQKSSTDIPIFAAHQGGIRNLCRKFFFIKNVFLQVYAYFHAMESKLV